MDDSLRVAGAVLVQTVAEGHFSPCGTTSLSPGALSSELDLGGSTDPFDLHFGNKMVFVTQSLHMALRSLQTSSTPRWLWVDALRVACYSARAETYAVLTPDNPDYNLCRLLESTKYVLTSQHKAYTF